MPSPAVELRDLHRRFGRHRVLRGIDLSVAPGAFVVLTGANGAGKTTLLRVLATLLRPTSGEGRVDGLSLEEEAGTIRERIAYVSARGFLYDDLTATENLRFTARLADAPVESDRIAELQAAAGLAHAGEQPVRTFSTGMRRRLSLITLRLRPVRVALIDEPFAGLDAEGVGLADRIIEDLRAAGTTVLLASHQSSAATIRADRKLRIVDGRLADERSARSG